MNYKRFKKKQKNQKSIPLANKWEKPQKVSAIDIAFGGRMEELLPDYQEIPEDFKSSYKSPWVKWQQEWFFSGLKKLPVRKDGIDGEDAMNHLATIQRSFTSKHEHKQAAVAWLASLWFKEP